MKLAIFCLALIGAAMAAPVDEPIPILRSENDVYPDGTYNYNFETGNGIFREEAGKVFNAGTDDAYVEVRGSYKYTDPDGELIEVTYTADQSGFHPEGKHILSAAAGAVGTAAKTVIAVENAKLNLAKSAVKTVFG